MRPTCSPREARAGPRAFHEAARSDPPSPPPPPGLNIDPLAPGLQGQKKFDSNISNPMPSNIKAGGRRGEFDSL